MTKKKKRRKALKDMSLEELKNKMDVLARKRDEKPYSFGWANARLLKRLSTEYHHRISKYDSGHKVYSGGGFEMGKRGKR